MLLDYGLTTSYSWFTIHHICLVARVYLIKFPKYSSHIAFVAAYGTWSLVILIVGTALGYNQFLPGMAR